MKQLNTHNNQKGAVLAVSLMILLVATLVAVASIDTSLTQEKMASNTQNLNRAFQAAESAVEDQITEVLDRGNLNMFSTALMASDQDDPQWPEDGFDNNDNKVNTSIRTEYKGEITLSSGNSMDADEGKVRVSGARFEYVATSTTTSGASVDVVQGVDFQ